MKKCFLIITLAGTLGLANGQEVLPREEALKLAFAASLDLAQLQTTPIPTDVDLKRPLAVREGEYGGLFLPEAKLNAQAIANAADKVVAIGQLWLHRLTPVQDGQPVNSGKLRMAKVSIEGDELRVPQCTLGVRRTGGKLELLVFGKAAEPVATAPLTVLDAQAKDTISLEADRDSSGGTATVVLFGKYKAQLAFTELED